MTNALRVGANIADTIGQNLQASGIPGGMALAGATRTLSKGADKLDRVRDRAAEKVENTRERLNLEKSNLRKKIERKNDDLRNEVSNVFV